MRRISSSPVLFASSPPSPEVLWLQSSPEVLSCCLDCGQPASRCGCADDLRSIADLCSDGARALLGTGRVGHCGPGCEGRGKTVRVGKGTRMANVIDVEGIARGEGKSWKNPGNPRKIQEILEKSREPGEIYIYITMNCLNLYTCRYI